MVVRSFLLLIITIFLSSCFSNSLEGELKKVSLVDVEWQLKNLPKNSISENSSPLIYAEVASSINGSSIGIYSDSECSSLVSQTVVNNGKLEFNNIVLNDSLQGSCKTD